MQTSETILRVRNLQKSFGSNKIHSGVSFELKEAEILGLLGHSGTGKSVLLRSIIGLETIDDGEIWFRDRRIDQLKEDELFPIRTRISYSFQNGALFDSVNVFENLAYPLFEHTNLSLREIQERVSDALGQVDLPGREAVMPSELSGGMQKRVGLARSFILRPDVLLFDEPTAGLDPLNVENIIKIMCSLKEQGMAGIFVTHDIPAALKVCDSIAILNKGKIAINETPSKIKKMDDSLVREFFGSLDEE